MMMRVLLLLCLFSLTPPAQAEEPRALPESNAQMQLSFAPLVKHTAPAVVNIYTSKRVKVRQSPFMSDPIFEKFFGEDPIFSQGFGGRTREQISNSLGSGVIVREDGLVVTNLHVVKGADAIRVVLADKQEFDAEVVLTDPRTDLALVKIDAPSTTFPALTFGQVDDLEVGDLVLAVGNPFGVGQTVTSGIVSAMARTTVGIADFEFFIQTDAAINPGNSGGALINMHGQLIGINTAIYSKTGSSTGIGFATPAVMAQLLVSSYEHGSKTVVRPWLGITTQNVTRDIAKAMGMKSPSGAVVRQVVEGSSAAKAGITIGDVITHVDGHEVADQAAVKFRIATTALGQDIPLQLLRNGKAFSATVRTEPPLESPPRQTTKLQGNHPLGGLVIANLSPALVEELGIDDARGVIVLDLDRNNRAMRVLQPLDIIRAVNGVKVTDVNQLVQLLNDSARGGWEVQIQRGGKLFSLAIGQ